MSKFITIGEAAKFLGVSAQTLKRRYDITLLDGKKRVLDNTEKLTLAYARVSSHDQKEDLQRQEKMLEMFCASQGWNFEVVSDLGSGMNYHKKGLKKLIHQILSEEICRLVLTHKDRLLRFGSDLVFAICEEKNVEVVLINKGSETSFEEELASDVLEIITVFSARLYGSRSRKNKKLIENLQQATYVCGD